VIGNDNRFDSIECNLNDSEYFKVHFDNKGRVNKVFKLRNNKIHGFFYYFSKYKLDSIRRYSEGKLTPELYLFDSKGKVKKHILFMGQDRDTTYKIKDGRTMLPYPFQLGMGINTQCYLLDSQGYLITIYDQDIAHHYSSSKYYVLFSSGGKYLSAVYSYEGTREVLMFSRGRISVLYAYDNGFSNGFRLYFFNYPKTYYDKVEIKKSSKRHEVLMFRKNGKLKTVPHSPFHF
jgi:hypothetical protein